MKRGEALRGRPGLSSKGHVHGPKDRPQLGGHGGQGSPARAQGHRYWGSITIPTQVCIFPSELDHSTRLQKLQRQATSTLRVAGALSTPGKGQELVLGSAGARTKAFIFQAKFELSKGPRKKSTY